ncbi:MAG: PD-(D/E)XK nuclease family protein [Alistipes sp.]
MDNGKSFFMCDDSECDHGKETMMDYELSWVIRLAADKEQCKGNEVLYDKCRAILGKLLGEKCVGEYRVESANVWKQWKRIDLIANIVLENDGYPEKHIIIIENKAYTQLRDNQLAYSKIVDVEYGSYLDWEDCFKHFWVITCFEPDESGYIDLVDRCRDTCWTPISLTELQDNTEPLTGEALFDEFWLKYW